jgi:putative redox protein
MTQMDANYLGNLRCSARHKDSGAELLTDAPRDNQGLGSSFSPTDLLATALLTCMQTVMGITARGRGWDISNLSGSVRKEMSKEGPRRVARLMIDLYIPGEWSPQDRAVLEQSARSCPVAQSLSPEIEQAVTFSYGLKTL